MAKRLPLPWPARGLHKSASFAYQPEITTGDALNVWTYDTLGGRARGGQRPGSTQLTSSALNGSNAVQDINHVTTNVSGATSTERGGVWVNAEAGSVADRLYASDLTVLTNINAESASAQTSVGRQVQVTAGGKSYYCGGNGTATFSTASTYDIDGNQLNEYVPGSGSGARCMSTLQSDGSIYISTVNSAKAVVKLDGSMTEVWDTATSAFTNMADEPYGLDSDGTTVYCGGGVNTATNPTIILHTCAASDGTPGTNITDSTLDTASGTRSMYDVLVSADDTKIFCCGQARAANSGADDYSVWAITKSDSSIAWRADIGNVSANAMAEHNGSLWVVSDDTGSPNYYNLHKITIADGTVTSYKIDANDEDYTAIAIASNGNMYLGRSGTGLVHKVHVDAPTTILATSSTFGSNACSGLAVRADGLDSALRFRDITLAAVSNGRIYSLDAGVATDESGAADLITTDYGVQSVAAFGKIYYVDGTNNIVFDPAAGAGTRTSTWTPTAGSLPSSTTGPQLISLWRARIVLSGVEGDGHNWFMSAVGDPLDFDYSPATQSSTQAVAGNSANIAGTIGDKVTALIPYSDDVMIFGCDHTIYALHGDPVYNGSVDRITEATGIAWGDAWAIDPSGVLYFWGTNGLYRMIPGPGAVPDLLSKNRLDSAFRDVDPSVSKISLQWDVQNQGLWIFLTPRAGGQHTHYFWDSRLDAFWPVRFPNDHGPNASHVYDGDSPNDRQLLLGGFDSQIYYIDNSNKNDDTTAINAYCDYPIIRPTGDADDVRLISTKATVAQSSSNVTLTCRVGDDPEEAQENTTNRFSATLSQTGRNPEVRSRARGNAIILRVANSTAGESFAMEDMSVELSHGGQVRA